MKSIKVMAIVAGSTGMLWGSALLAAQPGAFGAGAQGRPADYLQTCKVPAHAGRSSPRPARRRPAAPSGDV